MKIAIIIQNISLPNGTERAVCNLANILAQKHRVSIVSICSKIGQSSGFYLDPKIDIQHLDIAVSENSIDKFLKSIRTLHLLKKHIRSNGFDIVFGSRRIINLQLPFLSAKCRKVGCEHFNYGAASRISRVLMRIFYPKLDAVVLLTRRDAEKYSFITEAKRFVIPNSRSFVCDEPAVCENKRIIALGRFSEEKGFDYLLQTAVKLKQEIPDWHLDIFGSGDDEAMLKELARNLMVDDFVSFLPPTKEVCKELCNSSIYVLSSRHEGLPMVLLEAQECGLPIVSFDCPEGPSEVIHDGKDGFLVPPQDTAMLAEKIITLARNQDMRKQFGKTARINGQRFSTEKVGAMWMDLVNKITGMQEK